VKSGDNSSQAPSIHVDNILAGLKQEEVLKGGDVKGILKAKEEKYAVNRKTTGLKPINEDILERQSQNSMASQGIDDILVRGQDPRRPKHELPRSGLSRVEEEKMFNNQSSFLS
jgi:hypothetical protein